MGGNLTESLLEELEVLVAAVLTTVVGRRRGQLGGERVGVSGGLRR